ncbi:palmitoleoyl- carboxylesterase NOTUM [Brachionus plicatilis]|uniref:Palmitoleoyl-carboxylesterase NOTUM n=1 Tax=Brachionus plicatilis TaxID=10195 RepID=A0A3M7RV52_BRAPC|nr:palmitoleoyl- carboxylesterase NOTUM [Brachionus plicatilis]
MSTMAEEDKVELKKPGLFSNYIVRDLTLWFIFMFILPIVLFAIYMLSKQSTDIESPSTHKWFTKPLQKVDLNNSDAVCNDGSPASYYMRSTGSKVWIVLLEGGYFCYDQASCSQRYLNSYNLTTSRMNSNFKFSNGILSSDPNENPKWSNINMVEIPYCSSDLWTGRKKSDEFSFMGYEIVSAVFDDLIKKTSIAQSELVMLTGVSAGGIGVLMNAERIQKMFSLHAPKTKLKLVIDSSWQLDLPYSYLCTGNECLMKKFFDNAIKYWNAAIPDECARKENGSMWNCFLPKKILNFIKMPVFVIQSKFDETQLLEQFNHVNSKSNRIAETFRLMDKKLRENLIDVDSYYVSSCVSHITLTSKDWSFFKVDNLKMSDALFEWAIGGKTPKLYDSCKWPDCQGTCPSINHPGSSQHINSFEYLAYLGLVDRNQIAHKHKLSLNYLKKLNYFKLMKLIMD